MADDGAKTWLVEKYARFVPTTNKEENYMTANSVDRQDQSRGEWKVTFLSCLYFQSVGPHTSNNGTHCTKSKGKFLFTS